MMTLARIKKIIDKVEGAGTYVLNTPLVFYRISGIVNSFDWSNTFVRYDKCRVIFKSNGTYQIVPVMLVKEQPIGTVGVDYDIVAGKYWLYMKPGGVLAHDTLGVSGIGSIKLYNKVSGGVV